MVSRQRTTSADQLELVRDNIARELRGEDYIMSRLSQMTSKKAARFQQKHIAQKKAMFEQQYEKHRIEVDEDVKETLANVYKKFQSHERKEINPIVPCSNWPDREKNEKLNKDHPLWLWNVKQNPVLEKMVKVQQETRESVDKAFYKLEAACSKRKYRQKQKKHQRGTMFDVPKSFSSECLNVQSRRVQKRQTTNVVRSLSQNDMSSFASFRPATVGNHGREEIKNISRSFMNLFSRNALSDDNSFPVLEDKTATARENKDAKIDCEYKKIEKSKVQKNTAPVPSLKNQIEREHAFVSIAGNYECLEKSSIRKTPVNSLAKKATRNAFQDQLGKSVSTNEIKQRGSMQIPLNNNLLKERKKTGTSLYVRRLKWYDARHGRSYYTQPMNCVLSKAKSRTLSLRGRGLMPEAANALGDMLSRNEHIEVLDCSFNQSMEDSGGAYIFNSLQYNKTLTSLNLSACKLGIQSIKALVLSMERNYSLKSLILSSNDIDDYCMKLLEPVMTGISKTITKLDLSKNKITEIGAQSLGHIVSMSEFNLVTLDIKWNRIQEGGGIYIANGCMEMLKRASAPVNGVSIRTRAALRDLDVSFTGIDDRTGVLLGKIMEDNASPLCNLICSHNPKLGMETAIALAKGLRENCRLRKLDVGHCSLTIEGMLHIVSSLQENFGLNLLRLENNNVKPHLQYIYEGIAVILPRQLSLRCKKYGSGTCTTVIVAFPNNNTYFSKGYLRGKEDSTNSSEKEKGLVHRTAKKYRKILRIGSIDEAPPRFNVKALNRRWNIKNSIFRGRILIAPSNNKLDTVDTYHSMFDDDWRKLVKRKPLENILMFDLLGSEVGTELDKVKEEIEEVKDEVRKRYRIVNDLYLYYSTISGSRREESFAMDASGWKSFAKECRLIRSGKNYETLREKIIDLFELANEESGSDDEDQAKIDNLRNPERSMLRFEFLEALLRTALLKFIVLDKKTKDLSDSVDMLFDMLIIPNIPQKCRIDANLFRSDLLYCSSIDTVLNSWVGTLQKYFDRHIKAGYILPGEKKPCTSGTNLMTLNQWIRFLIHFEILDESNKDHYVTAILIFKRSIPAGHRETSVESRQLAFVSFLEALCRTAAYIQFWGDKETVVPQEYIKHCCNIHTEDSMQQLKYYQSSLEWVEETSIEKSTLVHNLRCLFCCFKDIESKRPYEEESKEDYTFLNQVRLG